MSILSIQKNDVLIFNKHVADCIYKYVDLPKYFFYSFVNETRERTKNFYLACIVLENLISLGLLNSTGVIINYPIFGSEINLLYLLPRNININLNSQPNFDIVSIFSNVLNFFKLLFKNIQNENFI